MSEERQRLRPRMADPSSAMELRLGAAIMAAVPIHVLLQAWLAHARADRWRSAAMAPLVAMVPALAWSLYALPDGSSLWPVAVILIAPFCLLYLLILCAARGVIRCLIRPGT